jgi:3-hydroxyisobutyrate dehydrogenase-like beta-hydroxyacid dehydrogenase
VSAVAFLGLGAMGSRIARRLLDAGHELIVWNRTAAKAAELVQLGATPAESPADAARRAEVVITMVANPQALHDVTEGPNGAAAGADGSTTIIEMSTVGPTTVSRLASVLSEGTGLLDAPVLGSLAEAESGTLHVFVGGPDSLVEQWTPLLSELGSPTHVGPLGAGAAAKLVANTTLIGTVAVLGEAIGLAQGLGLSRDATFAVLSATSLGTQAERRREAIETGEYPPRFALSLARKDADLIADAAAAAGIDLRVVEAARSWFREADGAGWGNRDYTAVLTRILRSR